TEALQVTVEVVPAAVVDDRELVSGVVAPRDVAERAAHGRHDGRALVRPDVVAEVIAGDEVAVAVRVVARPLAARAGGRVVAVVVLGAHRVVAERRTARASGAAAAGRADAALAEERAAAVGAVRRRAARAFVAAAHLAERRVAA